LEEINTNEQGMRQKKAQLLLNRYTKASKILFIGNVCVVNGVTGTFMLPCHSSLYAEPENQNWGTDDLYVYLMFNLYADSVGRKLDGKVKEFKIITDSTSLVRMSDQTINRQENGRRCIETKLVYPQSTFTVLHSLELGLLMAELEPSVVECLEKEYSKEWNFRPRKKVNYVDVSDSDTNLDNSENEVNGGVSGNDQTHFENNSVSRECTSSSASDDVDESNTTPIQEGPSLGIDYYESINKIAMQNDNGGFRTPPHQIVSNTYNPEISINENILRMSAMSLAKLDESRNSQKNNPYSSTIDDVMDIRGESGFAKFLSVDDYIKLLSKKPKRRVELPGGWRNVVEEYYKETTENGSVKSISDWIRITEELGIVKEEDDGELIKLKKYLNRVMLPLIESFSKQAPDISAPDSSEHHYWSEFGHRFFSRALQEFVDLDWRVMEVPVQSSRYRKNYGYNHIIDTVVDGKYADLLARMRKTGEEIFVGEQAGPPTRCDLAKLATDSFKLYREMRDCLNVRILRAMGKGDVNYNNRSVFGILGFLFEIKMLIMWKDGVYVYEEYGSLNIASNPGQISEMKLGILRLLEFMLEAERTEFEAKNAKPIRLWKRMPSEKLKMLNSKQICQVGTDHIRNFDLKDRITKLKQKQTQAIINEQE
ncbi:5342_t:CDS:10, partial [Acaulospora colombiana]